MTNMEQAEYVRKLLGIEYECKKLRVLYTDSKGTEVMSTYISYDTVDEFKADIQTEGMRWWIAAEDIQKIELMDRDTLETVTTFYVEL